jgi:hypothetical protein
MWKGEAEGALESFRGTQFSQAFKVYIARIHIQNIANHMTTTSYITCKDEIIHDGKKDGEQVSEGPDGHEDEARPEESDNVGEVFAEAEGWVLGGGKDTLMSHMSSHADSGDGEGSGGSAERVKSAIGIASVVEASEHIPEPVPKPSKLSFLSGLTPVTDQGLTLEDLVVRVSERVESEIGELTLQRQMNTYPNTVSRPYLG